MTPTEEKQFERDIALALKPVLAKWAGHTKWFLSAHYTQNLDRKIKFLQIAIMDEEVMYGKESADG